MNQTITRRRLLSSTALVPFGAALAGCATLQAPGVPAGLQQVAQDVALIAQGLGHATLSLPGLIPAGTLATVQKYLAQINQVAELLGQAPTAAAGAPLIQQLEGAINGIVAATGTLQLPGKWNDALAAVEALLPVIEVAVGLVVPTARAARSAMTPAQARQLLGSL